MLKITVPCRIHITLVDLGSTGYRRGGGIGFSVSDLGCELSFAHSERICLAWLKNVGFSAQEVIALEAVLQELGRERGCAGIELCRALLPGRHAGFGSGTAVALAVIEAFSVLNNLGLSESEIVRRSNRGGTSGIGISTYFSGGFIVDIGRPFYPQKIVSSDSVSVPQSIATTLLRLEMPSWPLGVVRFDSAYSVKLDVEAELFRSVLPIAATEVASAAYHSIFGATAAVADGDVQAFCGSINAIQKGAWKSAEISLHGAWLKQTMEELSALGASAVGLSSVGPGLYFLADNVNAIAGELGQSRSDLVISVVTPCNHGRVITHG